MTICTIDAVVTIENDRKLVLQLPPEVRTGAIAWWLRSATHRNPRPDSRPRHGGFRPFGCAVAGQHAFEPGRDV